MKHFNFIFTMGIILFSLMSSGAIQAQKFSVRTQEGQKLNFEVLSEPNKTVKLVTGSYKDASYVIPQLVKYKGNTYTVTEIGDRAFYERRSLHNIELPTTIERIGDGAFEDAKLKEVNLPTSLKHISSDAFKNCRLESIVVPEGVTYIGDKAFDRNRNVMYLSLPSTLRMLGKEVFCDNSATTISFLPEIITPRNCANYGLSEKAVYEYYKRLSVNQSKTRSSSNTAATNDVETSVLPQTVGEAPAPVVASAIGETDENASFADLTAAEYEEEQEVKDSSVGFIEAGYLAGSFDEPKYTGFYGFSSSLYTESSSGLWTGMHFGFNFNNGLAAASSAEGTLLYLGPAIGYKLSSLFFVGGSVDLTCGIYDKSDKKTNWGLDISPTLYFGKKFGVYVGPRFTIGFSKGSEFETGFRAGLFLRI
jgi:hypothetical protein